MSPTISGAYNCKSMSDPVLTVYTPASSLKRPGEMLREMYRDLARSRELAWRLAMRDVRAQHRQAFFGVLWAVIVPLANIAAWIFLEAAGIISVGEARLSYVAYVITGALLWGILMDALNAPLQQTSAARAMLSKVRFPYEALIVSGIYQTLFNAAVKTALLLAALPFLGIDPGWRLLLFPLGVLSLVLVGTALGLLITPVGLLYTDVGRALPLLAQFLMFVTPVVFPMPQSGLAAAVFSLNPLSPLILTARDWLTGFAPEHLGYFLLVNAVALALLLGVWLVYRLAMPILIERMGDA